MITVSESAEVAAPAAHVYELIADYRDGHPRILPPRWFGPLVIEEGAVGEGTLIRFEFRAAGMKTPMRARISEPEPGRRIVETNVVTGAETMFIVDPLPAGRCRVEIRSQWESRGLRGLVERALVPRLLRRVFRDELHQLGKVATSS